MGGNSSPARGGGPSQTVEGHVQRITTPEGQDNQSVPLHHASHGPPPHSGEDFGVKFLPSTGRILKQCTSRPRSELHTDLDAI